MHTTTINIHVQGFVWTEVFILGGKYQGTQLPQHMVKVCSVL